MLVPDIKNEDSFDKRKSYTIEIEENDTPMGSMYNYEILTDDKAKDKFIKYIERIIRQSYEYKLYIGTLKNVLNYTKCTFLPKIDINEIKGVPIEFHHYPFTLYDLVSIEVNYEIDMGNNNVNPFDIAGRILKYHFQNLVGLVPLSETVHELVHDGKKFINIKYIKGDYEAYLEKNANKIPNEFIEKIDNLKYLSKQENEGINIDGSLLDVKILNLIQEGTDEEHQYLELDETEKKTKTALRGDYDRELIQDMKNTPSNLNLEDKTIKSKKKRK